MRLQLLEQVQLMQAHPLRCLAMAFKEGKELSGSLGCVKTVAEANALPELADIAGYAAIESNMVLSGIAGIKDPARPEAGDAIKRCGAAGVRVMMMTGDSRNTAVAIAKDVNIFGDYENDHMDESAFSGKDFFSLPEQRQLDILRRGNKVFCRTEPRDKQRLVRMLDSLGEVCAMTGDGVNDAPALQQASIGIAMGVTGTEVAKSAADMVLADDNFATIVAAVEEGRNIYSNMQSFICFLLSTNIGEIITILLATLMGLPEPLSPLHLLWLNLVTDGPPATALGFNPPDPAAMTKRPRARSEHIMSHWLLTRYVLTGLYVGFATVGSFVWWYKHHHVSLHQLMNWDKCPSWLDFAHSADPSGLIPREPCGVFENSHRAKAQSLSLSTLVLMEMLKALSAVSLDASMFKVSTSTSVCVCEREREREREQCNYCCTSHLSINSSHPSLITLPLPLQTQNSNSKLKLKLKTQNQFRSHRGETSFCYSG